MRVLLRNVFIYVIILIFFLFLLFYRQSIFTVCREVQSLFNEEREMSIKTIAFCKTIFKHQKLPPDSRRDLAVAIISLKCSIPDVIGRVQCVFDGVNYDSFEEIERTSLVARTREILMQGYRFGFEVSLLITKHMYMFFFLNLIGLYLYIISTFYCICFA